MTYTIEQIKELCEKLPHSDAVWTCLIIPELVAEVERLRGALEFYADEKNNYEDNANVEKDCGALARKVLGICMSEPRTIELAITGFSEANKVIDILQSHLKEAREVIERFSKTECNYHAEIAREWLEKWGEK